MTKPTVLISGAGIAGPSLAYGLTMAMKYVQRWPFRSFAERKWFTTADAVDLPDYRASSKARRA